MALLRDFEKIECPAHLYSPEKTKKTGKVFRHAIPILPCSLKPEMTYKEDPAIAQFQGLNRKPIIKADALPTFKRGPPETKELGRETEKSPQHLGIRKIKANHHDKIILIAYGLYGEYMLKFCVVCVLITRLQSEIPGTQSHPSSLSLQQGRKVSPNVTNSARQQDNANFS